jgi:hypothetical protein
MGRDRQRLIAAEQAPFQKLIKLIERELELAGQGRVQELKAAVAETGKYMASLPSPAPSSALPLVERAKALRGRVTIETERLRESIGLARAARRRSRRIARQYGQGRKNRYSTTA